MVAFKVLLIFRGYFQTVDDNSVEVINGDILRPLYTNSTWQKTVTQEFILDY